MTDDRVADISVLALVDTPIEHETANNDGSPLAFSESGEQKQPSEHDQKPFRHFKCAG